MTSSNNYKTIKLVDYRDKLNNSDITRGPGTEINLTVDQKLQNIDNNMIKKFKITRATSISVNEIESKAWLAVSQFHKLDLSLVGKYKLITIDDIPYKYQFAMSCIFDQVLQIFNDVTGNCAVELPTDTDAVLTLHYILSYLMLAKKHVKSISERIMMFVEYKWPELIDDMINCLKLEFAPNIKRPIKSYKGNKSRHHPDTITMKINRNISHGELGKAYNICTSDMQQASASAQLRDLLQSKHPQQKPENRFVEKLIVANSDISKIKIDDMSQIIQSLHSGVSPGPDGLRNEHIKQFNSVNKHFKKSLTIYCNTSITGKLPQWYYDKLAEASLIALSKNDGETTATLKELEEDGWKNVDVGGGVCAVDEEEELETPTTSSQPTVVVVDCANTFTGLGYQAKLVDIRPIAMGSVWRKITSKGTLCVYKAHLADKFAPYQFGAGATLGTESIVHIIRSLLALHPEWSVLKVDYKNAFNTIFRKALVDAVKKHAPGMLSWVQANHLNATKLWHKCLLHPDNPEHDIIWSEEGVQQGEVGGPVNFCLTIHDILIEINVALANFGGGVALAYMDDLTIIAPHLSINQIWDKLVDSSALVGLVVNPTKCQIYNSNMDTIVDTITLPPEITRKDDGLIIVGTPIGNEQFELAHWESKLKGIRTEIEKACSYDDTQVALMFLSKCISTKLNYYTRMTDPQSPAGLVGVAMDADLCYGLNIILKQDISPDDNCWVQARLAAKHSGLGIQSPISTHAGAFLSSQIGCHNIINKQIKQLQHNYNNNNNNNNNSSNNNDIIAIVDNASNYLCTELSAVCVQLRVSIGKTYQIIENHCVEGGTKIEPLDDLLREGQTTLKLQKHLNMHVSNNHFKHLWKCSSAEEKIRLDSSSAEGGCLVTTVPREPAFKMDPEHFAERICSKLGLPINYIRPGPCTCGKESGSNGFHLQSSCKLSAQQKTNTHDVLKFTWYEFGTAAGYRCKTEDSAVFKQQGIYHQNGRVDVVFECFEGARPLYGDVSVTDARQLDSTDYVNGKHRENEIGEQGRAMEKSKFTKYNSFDSTNAIFKPLVFETLGLWAPEARKVFKTIIHKMHLKTGTSKHILSSYWRSRLCFAQHKTAALGLQTRSDMEDVRGQMIRDQMKAIDWDRFGHVRTL